MNYDYTDEEGNLLYQVQRSAKEKKFRQRRPDPVTGEWIYNLDGVKRVPYNLVELQKDEDRTLFVVEGEKDVETLRSAGLCATTSAGGSSWEWPSEWHSYFDNRREVVVVADNDEPGRKAANQRALFLASCTMPEVRLLEYLPHVDEKGDITDYLSEHSVDELWQVVEETPRFVIPKQNPKAFVATPLDLRTEIERPEELVSGLYAGLSTTLQAEPGVGKSWIALWWAEQITRQELSVIYFDEEGGPAFCHRRLKALGADPDLIPEYFNYFPFESRKWDEDDLKALEDLLDEVDPVLCVFDSLADFLTSAGYSENNSDDVNEFIAKVRRPFRERNIATLTLDHLTKPSADGTATRYARGSGAKLAKDDASIRLQVVNFFDLQQDGTLFMYKTKDRHGSLGLPWIGQDPIRIDIKNKQEGIRITQKIMGEDDYSEDCARYVRHAISVATRITRSGLKAGMPKYIPKDLLDPVLDQLVAAREIRQLSKDLFVRDDYQENLYE